MGICYFFPVNFIKATAFYDQNNRQNEAPTNLLKRRLPSYFSKRGEKKFLSQQVFEFPASHQNIQP